jgi:hypothetical protein
MGLNNELHFKEDVDHSIDVKEAFGGEHGSLGNHTRNYYFIVKEVWHLLYKEMHLFIFTHGWIIWSSLFWSLIVVSFLEH